MRPLVLCFLVIVLVACDRVDNDHQEYWEPYFQNEPKLDSTSDIALLRSINEMDQLAVQLGFAGQFRSDLALVYLAAAQDNSRISLGTATTNVEASLTSIEISNTAREIESGDFRSPYIFMLAALDLDQLAMEGLYNLASAMRIDAMRERIRNAQAEQQRQFRQYALAQIAEEMSSDDFALQLRILDESHDLACRDYGRGRWADVEITISNNSTVELSGIVFLLVPNQITYQPMGITWPQLDNTVVSVRLSNPILPGESGLSQLGCSADAFREFLHPRMFRSFDAYPLAVDVVGPIGPSEEGISDFDTVSGQLSFYDHDELIELLRALPENTYPSYGTTVQSQQSELADEFANATRSAVLGSDEEEFLATYSSAREQARGLERRLTQMMHNHRSFEDALGYQQ